MRPTRRQFLLNAASVAAATQLPLSVLAQPHSARATGRETPDPLAGISLATFEPWVGGTFRVTLNKTPLGSVTLISAKPIEPPSPAASALNSTPAVAMSAFSLQFQRVGAPLAQEVYLLEHDWLGTLPLLLVPSGLAGRTSTSTAIFAQLA